MTNLSFPKPDSAPAVPAEYKLPFPNAAIETFLTIANTAQGQVFSNQQACDQVMTQNENTITEVMPTFSQIQESFASGILYSTKALLLSAEAAYQAQSSVCGSLSSALKEALHQKENLQQRIQKLEIEIAEINQKSADLRASFTNATDSTAANESSATEEAKKLLICLEESYKKHEVNRALHKHLHEINANIEYLAKQKEYADNYSIEIAALMRRSEDEWRRNLKLFQADDAEIDYTTLLSPTLRSQQQEEEGEEESVIDEKKKKLLEERQKSKSVWSIIWDYLKLIIVAFLIAVVLRAYVFDITRVEGASMYPTLANNDNLITVKVTYLLSEPQRGDIIVLEAPDEPGADYIKRIIALPGEELKIKNGNVYINNELLDEPYLNGIETEGDIHTIIPEGFYFVMGDNRGESRDSRIDAIGCINKDNIIGKACVRLYPFSEFGSIY